MWNVFEALNVLKEWNSNWNPPFFLCDFSDAEFSALKQAFPSTTVYGCDFHREQAWTRWIQDRKNDLERSDANCLLELLRACVWAPPLVSTTRRLSLCSRSLLCGRRMCMFRTGGPQTG